MPSTVNEICNYESFEAQVKGITKYLEKLEGMEYLRSCNFLENSFRPYLEKKKEMVCKVNVTRVVEMQERNTSNHGKPMTCSSNAEQTFSEKFLCSIPDEAYLAENLLINNCFLEEINKSSSKSSSFSKNASSYSQSILVDGINTSNSYESTLSSPAELTYLDLSNKASKFSSIQYSESDKTSDNEEMIVKDDPDIILNLCSKSKAVPSKNDQTASSIEEEFDSLSYPIGTSTILVDEKNKSHYNNTDASKFPTHSKDDFSKIFNVNSFVGPSVIHCSNMFDKDKRLLPSDDELAYCVSDVEDSITLSNDTAVIDSNVDISETQRLDKSSNEIKVNCVSDTILNLKKKSDGKDTEFNINDVSVCSSLPNTKLPLLQSILNKCDSLNKYKNINPVEKTSGNYIKALNLMNKYKKNDSENVETASTIFLEDTSNTLHEFSSLHTAAEDQAFTNYQSQETPYVCQVSKQLTHIVVQDSYEQENLSPVSCRKCHTVISDYTLWTDHERNCSLNCYVQIKAKVHKKQLASLKRNTCTHCSVSFTRQTHLAAHMKKEHGITLLGNTYPCLYCSREFVRKTSLYHHLQLHASPQQRVCSKCGIFVDEAAFNEHMEEEHIKNAPLKCHICSAVFERHQQYNNHMEGHEKHKCVYCESEVSFSSKLLLFKHYKTQHPDLPQKVALNKEYPCDQCPRIFIRPSLLTEHKMARHKDMKLFECHQCNMKYMHRSSLKQHTRKEHTQVAQVMKKVHRCPECTYVCSSQILLNKHSLNTHKTPFKHSCPHCQYKTKYRHLLKRHTEAHLEVKKFLCEICGASFHFASTLKHHILFLHSNERKFKCKVCSKSFKNKSCLSRHSRIHSNERPYKCDCGLGYKQLAHLRRHSLTAHNKKQSKMARVRKIGQVEEAVNKENIEDLPPQMFTGSVDEKDESTATFGDDVRPNDMILPSNSAMYIADTTAGSDPVPLFTVLDSQLIQVIPSTDNLHAVSIMNGEFHTISIASAAPPAYHVTQNPTTPLSSNRTGATVIHATSVKEVEAPWVGELVAVGRTNRLGTTYDPDGEGAGESEQLTLTGVEGERVHSFNVTSTTVQQKLHSRSGDEDSESITSISSSPFLSQEGSASPNHEISTNNVSYILGIP